MAQIGIVTRTADSTFIGSLKSLSINTSVKIIPNPEKTEGDRRPDFRVIAAGDVEIGGGWIKASREGKPYVTLRLEAPELPRMIYANLGKAAGQDDDDVLAIIWIPTT